MDEIKAKQQVVEKIQESGKILVTVSDSPSVDALSAALGLAMILEKQEKYATAIFSGETPPAIAFLEPEKTFDDTTDSLRDFIIALNKEKADHLRYKVEGDSVKIFITPYKTTINQDDLEFSQGDYNVELVIALGVNDQQHLDKALENHGQILHDAAIVTMTAGDQTSDLGGIDWHDSNSSSLSEMVAGLAEALKDDKKKSLLDPTSATALLTGVVAETDRFSNEHTTSKVMAVAATLMNAGADQQLIANELQHAQSIDVKDVPAAEQSSPEPEQDASIDEDGVMTINNNKDSLTIDHSGETLAEMDKRVLGEEKAQEKVEDEIEAVEEDAKEEAEKQEEAVVERATPTPESLVGDVKAETPVSSPVVVPVDTPHTSYAPEEDPEAPTFGGTLSATTDEAEEDARRAAELDQNRTILEHAYIGDAPAANATTAVSDTAAGSTFPGAPAAAPGSQGVNAFDAPEDPVHSAYAPDDTHTEFTGVGGERVIQPLADAAQATAMPAYNPVPPLPPQPATDQVSPSSPYGASPADLGLPLPPPLPDFSQGGAPAIPLPPTQQPEILGDILAPEPATPPVVEAAPGVPIAADPFVAPVANPFDTSNAVPAAGSAYAFEPTVPELPSTQPQSGLAYEPTPAPAPQPAAPTAPSPGQFQIPGQ